LQIGLQHQVPFSKGSKTVADDILDFEPAVIAPPMPVERWKTGWPKTSVIKHCVAGIEISITWESVVTDFAGLLGAPRMAWAGLRSPALTSLWVKLARIHYRWR
jgi:hypothetical protein